MSLQLWITGNNGLKNQGLASINPSLSYTAKDNGKTGKCLNFGVSGSDTVKIDLGISVNGFTVTCWYRDPEGISDEDANSARCFIGYGNDDNKSLCEKSTPVPEWTFISIGLPNSFDDFCIYLGSFDYCDIRVYDHRISNREAAMIESCMIFQHQLGRGSDPSAIEAAPLYGLTDSSGYKHNLKSSSTIPTENWKYPSAVGDGSLSFDGSFYLSFDAINANAPYTIGSDELTISFWAKFDDWANDTNLEHSVIKFASEDNSYFTEASFISNSLNATIALYDNSITDIQIANADVTSLSSGWHMFMITRMNALGMFVYIDGKQVATATESKSGNVVLGAGSIGKNSDDLAMNEIELCDVRVYTTYMNSDEVLQKYEEKVGIDSNGNLYAYSNSPADSEIGIGGNGNVKGELIETSTGFKIYPDHIECSNYYEI